MNNVIGNVEIGLIGERALFASPESKCNGMPVSYQIPTFGALDELLGHIYRHKKPYDFRWRVRKIRVMNRISFFTETNVFGGRDGNTVCPQTYLKDPRYQVLAEIEYKDGTAPAGDADHENASVKAERIFAKRAYSNTPYDNIFFGRAECHAFSRKESFGEGPGFYDGSGEIDFGTMFVKYEYLDDDPYGARKPWFAHIVMKDGVVELPSKSECFTTGVLSGFNR